MRFIVVNDVRSAKRTSDTTVALETNNWDDYSYRTTFNLYVSHNGTPFEFVGATKILPKTWPGDWPEYRAWLTAEVMPHEFSELPDSFVSLGQTRDFYAWMGKYSDGRKILRGVNDLVVSGDAAWEEVPGFEKSLIRAAGAQELYEFLGREILRDPSADGSKSARVSYCPRETWLPPVGFLFSGNDVLPGRINLLIGKNGTGKTSLLAGIAAQLESGARSKNYESFSRALILTCNPFDDAYGHSWDAVSGIPVQFIGYEPLVDENEELLRQLLDLPTAIEQIDWLRDQPEKTVLAAFVDLASKRHPQFLSHRALEGLGAKDEWIRFVDSAFDEQWIADALKKGEDVRGRLSAGQKQLLLLYASLYKKLDRRALVVFDEPESHLHPSLIARFFHSLNLLLEQRNAFALIATHSPIVAQETPSKYVQVLVRGDGDTQIVTPGIETFGASLDELTEYLFQTDFTSSYWKSTLKNWSNDSDESLEEALGKPLTSHAKTFLRYHQLLKSSSRESDDLD